MTSYCGRPLEPLASSAAPEESAAYNREIRIFLPNKQRQHRTVHIQKDVLPYAWCYLLCPVSASLASFFRMLPYSFDSRIKGVGDASCEALV